MEWAKLGANVGLEVLKTVCDTKRDTQLSETIRQRDVYKKEAECLRSHLHDVKTCNRGNTIIHNMHIHNRKFNQGSSHSAKNHTKPGNQSQHEGRKPYQEHGGLGQNSTNQTKQQKSSQPWGNSGINTGKTWGNSGTNTGKTNETWGSSGRSNGKVNFSAPSGRGNSHSRGRGRGRGNSRQ